MAVKSIATRISFFDFLDIYSGTSQGQRWKWRPQTSATAAKYEFNDCNNNNINDNCDIIFGGDDDLNQNLIPDDCECIADIIQNGTVEFSDLITVVGNWGPCDVEMPTDIVSDGVVGVQEPCSNSICMGALQMKAFVTFGVGILICICNDTHAQSGHAVCSGENPYGLFDIPDGIFRPDQVQDLTT